LGAPISELTDRCVPAPRSGCLPTGSSSEEADVKSASTTGSSKLPDQPVNGVTAGVDWASQDHAVSVVNDRGLEIARKTIEHTAPGLRALVRFLGKHGVGEVAIERGDGPVV